MRDKTAGSVFCVLAVVILLAAAMGPAGSAPGAAPTVVPFDFYRHEVVIQATINGQGPFAMLLDTGTNPSVIDLSLARRLGLPLTPAGRGDAGGTEKNLTYETSFPAVGIGGLSAPNIPALALDLSELSRRFRRPICGILGDSLLSGRIVQFDYPARVVRFFPSSLPLGSALPRGGAGHVTLPFHNEDCVQINAVTVDGRPVRGNVDTGSNSAFALTPRAVRALGLTAQTRRARPLSGASYNGAYPSRAGTVAQITLGTIRVPHPAVTFWMPGTGHDSTPWDVNIGNVFLQHYVVTFDYPRKTITLDKPSFSRPSSPLPKEN